MSSQVDDYIEKQDLAKKEILREVRKIFREAIPNCEEKMRWGAITFASGKFYVAAMKNRVHIGFAISGLSDNEVSLFEGKGKTMRHIKIPVTESVDKTRLVRLIKMVDKKAVCKPC